MNRTAAIVVQRLCKDLVHKLVIAFLGSKVVISCDHPSPLPSFLESFVIKICMDFEITRSLVVSGVVVDLLLIDCNIIVYYILGSLGFLALKKKSSRNQPRLSFMAAKQYWLGMMPKNVFRPTLNSSKYSL